MKIEGDYSFDAPRELVWLTLRDPVALAKAMPGCERFDQLSASTYDAALRINAGPLQGVFTGAVRLQDIDRPEGYEILLEGMGPEGPVRGSGRLALESYGEKTLLRYDGDVQVRSHLADEAPRLLQTSANALIRQFMEALDRQMEMQTRVHTTEVHPTATAAPSRRRKSRATIDAQDVLAELRRDRRIVALLAAGAVLLLFFLVGSLIFLRALWRWLSRSFARQVAEMVEEERSDG